VSGKHRLDKAARDRLRSEQPTEQIPVVTDAQKAIKDPVVKKPGSPVAKPPRLFREKRK
jgi:hypothetical protein